MAKIQEDYFDMLSILIKSINQQTKFRGKEQKLKIHDDATWFKNCAWGLL